MFGDDVISSSESPVSFALGVPSPCACEVGFRREVGVCDGLLLVGGSERLERTGSSGSRIDIALEVVRVASSIIHFDGEDWCSRDFPFPEVISRSGVRLQIGVRDLSNVQDRSEVRWTCDCPRSDLSDPVLLCLGWEARALSGAFPVLPGLELAPGSTAVGGLCTTATSPTASYKVPDEDPGGAWYSTRLGVPPGGSNLLNVLEHTIYQP